jgi:hypothetical protein
LRRFDAFARRTKGVAMSALGGAISADLIKQAATAASA